MVSISADCTLSSINCGRYFSGSIKKLKNAVLTIFTFSSDIYLDLKALVAMSQIYFFSFFIWLVGKSGRSSEANILFVPDRLSVTLV
jgi:hypothetical protein